MASCWIYVLQDGSEEEEEYQVGYTMNLPERIKQAGACEEKLVYLRMFDDFRDAIGHKLFLERMSTPSLRRVIRIVNPDLYDLGETIRDAPGGNATDAPG